MTIITRGASRTLELDGVALENLEALRGHPSTELWDAHADGRLARWLRRQGAKAEADALGAFTPSGDRAADIVAIGAILGMDLDVEDVRDALDLEAEEERADGTASDDPPTLNDLDDILDGSLDDPPRTESDADAGDDVLRRMGEVFRAFGVGATLEGVSALKDALESYGARIRRGEGRNSASGDAGASPWKDIGDILGMAEGMREEIARRRAKNRGRRRVVAKDVSRDDA